MLDSSTDDRISEFKGQQYVDIREYYTDKETNELKPGKKGISLNKEQFELLAGAIHDIRDALPTSTSDKKTKLSSTASSS